MQLDKSKPYYGRLKNIEDYVKRGSDLTKQLLGFARRGKYETKPTNLTEFIRESFRVVSPYQEGDSVSTLRPRRALVVEVDRGQMEQVLLQPVCECLAGHAVGGSIYFSRECQPR